MPRGTRTSPRQQKKTAAAAVAAADKDSIAAVVEESVSKKKAKKKRQQQQQDVEEEESDDEEYEEQQQQMHHRGNEHEDDDEDEDDNDDEEQKEKSSGSKKKKAAAKGSRGDKNARAKRASAASSSSSSSSSEDQHSDERQGDQDDDDDDDDGDDDRSSINPSDDNNDDVVVLRKPPEAPPGVVQSIIDMMDYFYEIFFIDRSHRIENFENLEWWWRVYPANDLSFGRSYIRMRCAELLHKLAGIKPHATGDENEDDDSSPKRSGTGGTAADLKHIEEWDRRDWEDFEDDLSEIYQLLDRKDATVILRTATDGTLENGQKESHIIRNLETARYELTVAIANVHAALAPISPFLYGYAEGTMKLSNSWNNKIHEAGDFVSDMENEKARKSAEAFFIEDSEGRYKLASRETVQTLLEGKKFDMARFQQRVEMLVRDWIFNVYESDDVELVKRDYRNFSLLRKHLDKMAVKMHQQNLKALKENHGRDPLEESRNVAAQAVEIPLRARAAANNGEDPEDEIHDFESSTSGKSSKASGTNSKKRRAKIYDEIEAELDREDEEAKRGATEDIPNAFQYTPRKKARNKPPNSWEVPPDDGVFNGEGKVQKRRRWTADEKEAIKQGVKEIGYGKWAEIKKHPFFCDILRNRSSVQIKDCWRTMKKHKEVFSEDEEDNNESEDAHI